MATTMPATVWSPQTGDGEYAIGSADLIVDASGNNIADASANLLAATNAPFVPIADTTWSENAGS